MKLMNKTGSCPIVQVIRLYYVKRLKQISGKKKKTIKFNQNRSTKQIKI